MKRLAAVVGVLMVLGFAGGLIAGYAQAKGPVANDACANTLCTQVRPKARNCWKLPPKNGLSRHQRAVKCLIIRAARHFRINIRTALYRGWRESRFHAKVVNSYGYTGVFQFGRTTFLNTPYGKRFGDVRKTAKWNILAYAWYASRGQGCHWNAPNYCA